MADYKLAGYVNQEYENRSCYSFCMCPGGQVCCLMFFLVFVLVLVTLFSLFLVHLLSDVSSVLANRMIIIRF